MGRDGRHHGATGGDGDHQARKRSLLYDDNTNVVEAMKSNQIDAAIFDLPTALYLSAVVLSDGAVIGQFPADRSQNPDQFGLLMAEGSPLKECVNAALAELTKTEHLPRSKPNGCRKPPAFPVVK